MNSQAFALRTHDLSLSYGRVAAVEQLNLNVYQGEIYGFLGRNGAGKTSTIRMLMGVIRPRAGSLEILDFRGQRVGVRQKQRIGYVSQEQHFYSWMTCRGLGSFVSGFYPTWDDAEFQRLLARLDLPPDRKVAHLSGGMRVKLALALALSHHPPILILDEPTSGLDPVARREFLEIVRRQARQHQRTTFFSSHLVEEVERVADRVGILHRGRLRFEGSIDVLRASIREVHYVGQAPPVPAEPAGPAEWKPEGMLEAELVAPGLRSAATLAADTPDACGLSYERLGQTAQACGFTVLQPGFEQASSLILYGTPAQWQAAPFAPADIRQLSLEDIFIALASEVPLEL